MMTWMCNPVTSDTTVMTSDKYDCDVTPVAQCEFMQVRKSFVVLGETAETLN